MKRPPHLPGEPEKLFDSCVNSMTDPSIFVIFERDQCYPRYLITYRDNDPAISHLTSTLQGVKVNPKTQTSTFSQGASSSGSSSGTSNVQPAARSNSPTKQKKGPSSSDQSCVVS